MASGRKSTENRFAKANQMLVSGNKVTETEQTISEPKTTVTVETEIEDTEEKETKVSKNLKELIKKNSKSRGIAKTIYFDTNHYKKLEKIAKQIAKAENSSRPSVSRALKLILDDYFEE